MQIKTLSIKDTRPRQAPGRPQAGHAFRVMWPGFWQKGDVAIHCSYRKVSTSLCDIYVTSREVLQECGSKSKTIKQASQYLEVYPPPPSLWVSSVDGIKDRRIQVKILHKCWLITPLMIRGGLELASSYHEFTPSEFYTKTIRTDLETLKIPTTRHFFFDVIAIPALIHEDIHWTEHL